MGSFITDFGNIGMADIARVGGKNASLGELFRALKPQGVGVIDGFAITSDAYWHLLDQGGLRKKIEALFEKFDPENVEQLAERGHAARAAILQTPIPENLNQSIIDAYRHLTNRIGRDCELAVRSSATAEDLPKHPLQEPLRRI